MDSTVHRPRLARRIATWLAWGTPLSSCVAYLGVSLFAADLLTRPANHPSTLHPKAVSPDATAWSARTSDGLTLRGWYYPTPRRRHLVVLVHGLWASWPELAALGRDLHRRDFDVLLFDLRGHGQSDPSRIFMGRRERGDLRAVLSWAERQGFSSDRIGWIGFSMGGSTLLMEAAQNDRIQVAVLDSPYGSLPDLLNKQLPLHSHLPSWFNPGILTAAHLAFGVRTDDLVPIRSARRWGARPLLLIHGEADSIVPVSQARQLARAAGPTCRAVTLPGVEHVQAYDRDPKRYVAAVESFFQKHLAP
jgi:pimeloyl-ACP methyl ester carboxylesterase